MVLEHVDLYCDKCLNPVAPIGQPDDIGTQLYECTNSTCKTQTTTPRTKEQRDRSAALRKCIEEESKPENIKKRLEEAKNRRIIRLQEEQNGEREKRSQADRLIEYCIDAAHEFFVDQHQNPFVRIIEEYTPCAIAQLAQFSDTLPQGVICGSHQNMDKSASQKSRENPQIAQVPQPLIRLVNIPVRSKKFKHWLSFLMYKNEGKGAGNEAVSSAINVISGKCQYEGKRYYLYNRVAPGADGSIYIDMADEGWRAIKVTKDGWEITDSPPILFRRYNHQKPLIIPVVPSSLSEAQDYVKRFLNHVNVNDSEETQGNRLALICTMISYLIPNIPHPVMVVFGPQGAAKSYLHKLIRRIIDPSSVELLKLPRDVKEVIQQLDHHWLCFYDNLTFLSTDMSDTFCMAATGAGFSKRELYSDDDDVIFDYKRCIGLNGINPAARRGDLLDRSILIEVEKIKIRRTEAEVDAKFDLDKAFIFGGILTVLAEALRLFPEIKVKDYQRLADFHRWGCAIAQAYGSTSEAFSEAYSAKVANQTDEALNADPVGLAMIRFLEKTFKDEAKATWKGTPTELLDEITQIALELKIQTGLQTNWPRSPQPFSRRLNDLIPAINKKGYDIVSKKGTPRTIIISPSIQTKLLTDIPTENTEVIHYTLLSDSDSDTHKCDKCQAVQAKYKITNPSGSVFYVCTSCFEEYKVFAQAQGAKFVDDTMPEYPEGY